MTAETPTPSEAKKSDAPFMRVIKTCVTSINDGLRQWTQASRQPNLLA